MNRTADPDLRRLFSAALLGGLILTALVWLAVDGGARFRGDAPAASRAWAQAAPVATDAFGALDVWVDSGDVELAAWQVEVFSSDVTWVAFEGGEHAAFREAPAYDPRALARRDRIVLAAFDTGDDLPRGRTRVARLHYLIGGDPSEFDGEEPGFEIRPVTAANRSGVRIEASVELLPARDAELRGPEMERDR